MVTSFLFLCIMKMNSFDAVIFDLGGVIINLDYQKTISAFQQLGMSNFEQVYSQMAQTDLFDLYETGQISTQHFINLLLPHLPVGTSPNKVVAAWNAMILDVPLKKIIRKMKIFIAVTLFNCYFISSFFANAFPFFCK